jgi:prepilin-type processing-associated H-X9-DG protein
MGPNVAVTLKRVVDGTSKTIMLAEIRAGITEGDGRGVWALGHAGASLVAMYGSGGDDQGPNQPDYRADDVIADDCSAGSGLCQTSPPPNGLTQPENMNCSGGGTYDQATARSKHPGGVHVAMVDGSVQFVSDDIESSGCPGTCCTAWDYMITSADGGRLGAYNGAPTGRGAGTPCQ